jgi:hypothetical protein
VGGGFGYAIFFSRKRNLRNHEVSGLRATVLSGVILAGAALAAACASSPATTAAKLPLEMPEPPPRVTLDPVPAVAEVPPPEIPETTTPVMPTATAPTSPRLPAASTPAVPAGPPVAQTPEPARTPPPELRPAGPAGRTLTNAQVRERLVRTKRKLDAIDKRRLNAGKRADYDSAERFLAQAREAVSANNLLLAESSAEKAETLADGLR